MRYAKDHKAESRKKIVAAASRTFRCNGIAATGIDEVMRNAGLTKGAFSAHFRSKDDLVTAALRDSMEHSPLFSLTAGEDTLEGLIFHYLTAAHRDHPQEGCPAAALAPEIARLPGAIRETFAEGLGKMVSFVEARLPKGKTGAARREAALSVLATMLGTLQLARLAGETETSNHILKTGAQAALKLGREAAPAAPPRGKRNARKG
ncbi:MAG: TetR/AcrR family transcriptional regulator [Verrucomicrobium sp.]|nr:TetR/AcrR family transcriptional regulator [Verrucomicrobium sp.]